MKSLLPSVRRYAPAYERYGSQISAIHFIGPDKPWNSISWHAPGTSSSQDTDVSDSQRAYDYTSLVDMWYSVYDRHYRTDAPIPPSDFEVRRYTSAWDDPSASSGGALGLEDLRRVALEGVNAAAFFPSKTSGEGDYTSMPLEGRLDLMPTREEQSLNPEHGVEPTHSRSAASLQGGSSDSRQRADSPHSRGAIPQILEMPGPDIYVARERSRSPSTPEQQHAYLSAETPDRMGTLPTPGPNEYPPSPHLRSLSLPGTPSPAPALHHYNMRPDQGTPLGHIFPRRPSSPPMMSWNPAVEPPPTDAPDMFSFPTDTYFPNVWDREHPEHTSDVECGKPPSPETLFQVPPPPAIPEQLLQQGHYRGVTGSSEGNASPSPDRSKVKPLFPWENRPRHAPRRVFPGTDSPPPGMFLPARSSPLAAPERQGHRTSAPVSPLVGMPTIFSYENAWDSVPGIQKYASKLVRPSPAPWPLGPAFETAGKRGSPRERDDRVEISSLDVDDENDGDDESDGENGYRDESGRWITSGSESEAETDTTRRSRSGSISSICIVKRGKKEYRGRGVQTIRPVMRSVDIQVTPAMIAREKEPPRYMHPEGDSPGKQFWTSAGPYAFSPIQEAAFSGPPMPLTDAGPHEDPSGARSPRDFSYSGQDSPIQSPDQHMTPPSKPTIPPMPSLIQRIGDENETSPGASPISSAGPLSPIDVRYPIGLPQRKGGRVWDPARGVDVIKRTSEEVLARFLRGPEAIAQR
jgi:glycogenin